MIKGQKGNMALFAILPLLLLVGLYLVISARTNMQTEVFQREVRSKANLYNNVMQVFELNDSLENVSLYENKSWESVSKDGQTYTISVEPLFYDSEVATDIIDIPNNISSAPSLQVTRELTNEKGDPYSSKVYTLDRFKFVRLSTPNLQSNRFSTLVEFVDYDGKAFGSSSVSGKPKNVREDVIRKVVKSSTAEPTIPMIQPPNNTSTAVIPALYSEVTSLKVYKNGTFITNYYYKDSDKNKDTNGNIISLKSVDLSTHLSGLNYGDSVLVTYMGNSGLVKSYSLSFITTTETPITFGTDTYAHSEQVNYLLLNSGDISNSLKDRKIMSTPSKSSDAMLDTIALVNSVKIDTYQELSCLAKEHMSPISIFTRVNGSKTPSELTSPTSTDTYINTDQDFSRLMAEKGSSNTSPRQSYMEYKDSPCQTTDRTTAYDGLDLYTRNYGSHESFLNGFNTIPPYYLRMFSGSKAGKVSSSGSITSYTNNKLDTKKPFLARYNGDSSAGDLYNYSYKPAVTNYSARNKLYCTDYDLKVEGSQPYPYQFEERTWKWEKAARDYEVLLEEKRVEYNAKVKENIDLIVGEALKEQEKLIQDALDEYEASLSNPSGEELPPDYEIPEFVPPELPPIEIPDSVFNNPSWLDGFFIPFEKYLKDQGLVDSSGEETQEAPCITGVERNSTLIRYKPILNSSSSVTLNLINNLTGEVHVKIVSDVNTNFEDVVDKEHCASSSSKETYICNTEKEAIKGWNDEWTNDSAKMLIDAKSNLDIDSGKDIKGNIVNLTPVASQSTQTFDNNTKELTYYYRMEVPSNYDGINPSDLLQDVTKIKDFNRVTILQELNNSVPKRIEITSLRLTKAYFKIKIKNHLGEVVKEDFVWVKPE